ncbi:uncharacterized protein EURHEDRAFT_378732 [Aspergillus ruber CBS 135680]|uniref:DUF7719 domain-containing protein n=1 Tax=Aspergillus ruber (strain CBS 135680) TaxID=1388766 RepID=A0A017SBW5_ASPRC|nr:uncharacterized protein EURHEDRAFT_378732 [Aspergillus ruber CBS 135680]EYE94104.1 hypothetical protein EURHEDRAFT_378732 [Aspergillus ruber CBS 135680]
MESPRNRKQRRAAAAADSFDASSIPLAHPPRGTASGGQKSERTLVDIIAERKEESAEGIAGTADAEAIPGTRFVTVDPSSGEISGFDPRVHGDKETGQEKDESESQGVDEPLSAFLDTILLSFPLTTLHLTLAYLAAHQYAVEIPVSNLLRESAFITFPILTLLIHLAHGHIISFGRHATTNDEPSLFPFTSEKLSISFLRQLIFPPSLKTLVFLLLAVFFGAKLMTITNNAPYYAVMKRAPAIGTLWVWCILEVPLGASVLGALGPLGWGVWYKGYGIF